MKKLTLAVLSLMKNKLADPKRRNSDYSPALGPPPLSA